LADAVNASYANRIIAAKGKQSRKRAGEFGVLAMARPPLLLYCFKLSERHQWRFHLLNAFGVRSRALPMEKVPSAPPGEQVGGDPAIENRANVARLSQPKSAEPGMT